jgi:ABC-type multidrug transport system fused ATPase/permease subunit
MSDIFNRFYRQHRGIVVGHVLLTLITFPLEMLLLSYISGLIFQKIKDKNYRAFFAVLMGFFFAFLLIQFFHFMQDYMSSLIIPRLDTFTRTELLHVMLNHRYEEDELKVGELMHRMSKTPGHLYKHYSNTVNYLVPLCFSAVFFAGYLFWIHWKIGVLVSGVFIVLFVLYFWMFYLLSRDVQSRMDMEYGLMDGYEDTIANWESIRLTSTREEEKERMTQHSHDFETKQQQDIHRVNVLKIVSILLFNLLMLLLLGFGIYLSTKEKLFPYWKLIVLITAILLMSKTMTSLLVKSSDSIYHAGSVEQLKTFMGRFNRDPVDTSSLQAPPQPIVNHELEFHHVSFSYTPSSTPLLRDVQLRISFPSSVLILGAIGSGKSTLLKMLMGYYKPTTGSVTVDGLSVEKYPSAYLLQHITYMNQNVLLFNRTLLENIFYGATPRREALQELRDKIPKRIMDNLDTVAGKQGNMLSGGERQIVLLLRTYFKPNPVVLLDEPTANLDPAAKKSAEDIIRLMMKQKTVVCITHDAGMIPLFQHVYRLQDGVLTPFSS